MNPQSSAFLLLLILGTALGKTLVRKQPKTNSSPVGVVYVEVNSNNFANINCYSLSGNRSQPLFGIGIIFAANIRYDSEAKRAILYLNPNVQTVLDGADTYIRPLQRKGTKVLLSLLGDHQGAGICNFETPEAARDFAEQLNAVVRFYDLDGIDFDDEYAAYGENGTHMPNQDSFLWLLKELRQLMPDKTISFYFYGPATDRLETEELNAGDYLDYSWNSIYGTYSAPVVPKLTPLQLAPAATWIERTLPVTANYHALLTGDEGYGAYLYYDLTNENVNDYLSDIAWELYGDSAVVEDECLQSWPPEGTPAVHGSRERMRKEQPRVGLMDLLES